MRSMVFFMSALAIASAACDQPSRPDPVASVVLSPDTAFVMPDTTAQMTALARTSGGAAVSGVAFTWTSSDSAVATVSSTGLVTAKQRGRATISAFAAGVSGSATVQVMGPSGVRVLSGGESQDTIDAVLPELLLVEVRDSGGRPVSGTLVAFSGQPRWAIKVEAPEGGGFTDSILVHTDAGGRAAARVQMGFAAGAKGVVVKVAGRSAVDTVRYTVLPGAPAYAQIGPRDTAVSPGGTVALRGAVLDRRHNPTASTLEFEVQTGPGTVHARTGVVTTAGYGTTLVVGRMGNITATARVSAVPGGALAVASRPGGGMVVNVDGTGNRLVDWFARDLEWSPDGTRIVFKYSRGPWGLFSTTLSGPPVLLPNSLDAMDHRYSRDGRWLYFTNYEHGGSLWRMRPDGTGRERITTVGDSFKGPVSLSPDGRRIAHSVVTGRDTLIHVTDLVTGHRSEPLARGKNPEWSPTSDLIVFTPGATPDVPHTRSLFSVMQADGSGRRWTLSADDALSPPRWSPDGRWIAIATGSTVCLIEVETGLLIRARHVDFGSIPSSVDWGPAIPPR